MLKFNQEKGLSALAALLANPALAAAPAQLPAPPEEVIISPALVAEGYGQQTRKRSCADIIEEAGEIEYHELLIDDASGISCE